VSARHRFYLLAAAGVGCGLVIAGEVVAMVWWGVTHTWPGT
jgi:hypothetical protein